jgi:hypothetical protein
MVSIVWGLSTADSVGERVLQPHLSQTPTQAAPELRITLTAALGPDPALIVLAAALLGT